MGGKWTAISEQPSESIHICFIKCMEVEFKAVDKWVLWGAEALPNFWHFYVKCKAHSAQHTTANDM